MKTTFEGLLSSNVTKLTQEELSQVSGGSTNTNIYMDGGVGWFDLGEAYNDAENGH